VVKAGGSGLAQRDGLRRRSGRRSAVRAGVLRPRFPIWPSQAQNRPPRRQAYPARLDGIDPLSESQVPQPIRTYVRWVDATNRVVGRAMMYLIFVMMFILLLSSISRGVFNISYIWSVEIAQFMLTAYYILGGGYSMQIDSHVRMDLFYSRWSPRKQALADALTSGFLLFYIVFLLVGGISGTIYAIQYNQKNYSSWAPPLAPIKVIMCIGIALMLLQVIAVFFKDVAKARGEPLQ
jgi:TRAP-type mannitol/chloroaromatic compound transport system permease small subunit